MATKKTSRKAVVKKKTAAKKKIVSKKPPVKPVKKATKKVTRKVAAKRSAKTNIIRVPKAAPGSYNPNRPLSKNTLLLNQVRHFQQIAQEKGISNQVGGAVPLTEGSAAEYLKKVTAILHPEGRASSGNLPSGIQLNAKRGRNA